MIYYEIIIDLTVGLEFSCKTYSSFLNMITDILTSIDVCCGGRRRYKQSSIRASNYVHGNGIKSGTVPSNIPSATALDAFQPPKIFRNKSSFFGPGGSVKYGQPEGSVSLLFNIRYLKIILSCARK